MAYLDLEGLKHLGQRLGAVFVRKDQLANNLTTTEEGFALDARQGKALQNAVNGKVGMIDGFATLGASFWTAEGDGYTCSMFHPDVTANNAIIVSAAPASYRDYCDCGVFCSHQAARQLGFTAAVKPTMDLQVNIMILE